MAAWPRQFPDWRVTGANPAKLAAAFGSRVPSSGISTSMATAVTAEMPGNATKNASPPGEPVVAGDQCLDGRVDGGKVALDLAQALAVLPPQQRLAQLLAAVPGGGAILDQSAESEAQVLEDLTGGPVQLRLEHGGIDPMVLASLPVASAKRRAWRGLTLANGRPAAARARSRSR